MARETEGRRNGEKVERICAERNGSAAVVVMDSRWGGGD